MSNLKKDIEEIIDEHADAVLEARDEANTGRAVELQDKADQRATTQIINLIESVIPKSKNLAYRQGRQLPVLTGIEAKDLNHVKVKKYINFGYNQAIKDIKNKLIGGTK